MRLASTLLASALLLSSGCESQAPNEGAPEDPIAQLDHESAALRLAAYKMVADDPEIPMEKRIGLLARALAKEVARSDSARWEGSYLSRTDLVRIQSTRILGELATANPELLRERWRQASGAAGERLALALAYAGDKTPIPEIRRLLQQSDDPIVRMDAARALGILGASDAIPDLIAALQDPYTAHTKDHLGDTAIQPVREQAAGALRRLGVRISRDTSGDFQVEGQQ